MPAEHQGAHSNLWTKDRVDLLKRMWADGASASEIATALRCGVSRSAVIGKVHRLKLPEHRRQAIQPKPVVRDRGAGTRGNGGLARKIGRARKAGTRTMADVVGKGMQDKVVPIKPVVRDADIVPISLLELGPRSCRWPIGDPLEPGFGFCGCPIVDGKSMNDGERYCDRHKRRAQG